jgi:hypothetical protein
MRKRGRPVEDLFKKLRRMLPVGIDPSRIDDHPHHSHCWPLMYAKQRPKPKLRHEGRWQHPAHHLIEYHLQFVLDDPAAVIDRQTQKAYRHCSSDLCLNPCHYALLPKHQGAPVPALGWIVDDLYKELFEIENWWKIPFDEVYRQLSPGTFSVDLVLEAIRNKTDRWSRDF